MNKYFLSCELEAMLKLANANVSKNMRHILLYLYKNGKLTKMEYRWAKVKILQGVNINCK